MCVHVQVTKCRFGQGVVMHLHRMYMYRSQNAVFGQGVVMHLHGMYMYRSQNAGFGQGVVMHLHRMYMYRSQNAVSEIWVGDASACVYMCRSQNCILQCPDHTAGSISRNMDNRGTFSNKKYNMKANKNVTENIQFKW